jgi:hypothetical protein
MSKYFRIAAAALILFAGTALAQSELNNDSIVKMVKAGLGEDVIVSMIKTQPGKYALDPDTVIQLKQGGLSEKVINAMIEKNAGGSATNATPAPPPNVSPAAAAPLVDEVGVYTWIRIISGLR